MRTLDGFNVPDVRVVDGAGWGVARVALGYVYQGKRTCLGQGVWDADTGKEILNDRYPSSRGKWALPAPVTA